MPMGGVMSGVTGSPLTQGQIQSLVNCGNGSGCTKPSNTLPLSGSLVWEDDFSTYAAGDVVQIQAPYLATPFADGANTSASVQNGGSCTQGSICNNGNIPSGVSGGLGDFVIGGPGSNTSCSGIPLGVGWSWGQILSGTMSVGQSFGGICMQPELSYSANGVAGTGIFSGTSLLASVPGLAPLQFLSDINAIIQPNTYAVSQSGNSYVVNVSQSATITTPITGSLWAGPTNVRVFSQYGYAGARSVGVGTGGAAATSPRMFGTTSVRNIQEGFIAGYIQPTVPGSHGWARSGVSGVFIDATGASNNGVQMTIDNPGSTTVSLNYGALGGSGYGNCAATGTGSANPGYYHEFVIAWRSSAGSDGYVKLYIDDMTPSHYVAAAFGANQGGSCGFPTTLNAVQLNGEATADSPQAEFYLGSIAVYQGAYGASGSTAMILQ
jgi:hypothetical protein